ncbi:MAG: tetratricopeptide repeat protein [Verrucomicrobia bacterium]|nr:tetratricopeptide repeat protein [Verrucomicrobiota bacterium]
MDDKARSLLEAARREIARHKPKKAARFLAQAVEADPGSHELLAERAAIAISSLREYHMAVEDLTRALGVAPGRGAYYDMRGQAYWYLREYERALEDFNKAIEVDPDCASAHYHRGNFYDKLQRYEQAIGDMLRAVEIEPENQSYKRRLDELKRAAIRNAERLGEEPPAVAFAEPAIVKRPKPVEAPPGLDIQEEIKAEEPAVEPVPVAPAAQARDEASEPAVGVEPPAEKAGPGLWSLRIPTGELFGPVSLELLKLWALELRVKAEDELLPPGGEWVPALAVPELAAVLEELRTMRKPPVRPD